MIYPSSVSPGFVDRVDHLLPALPPDGIVYRVDSASCAEEAIQNPYAQYVLFAPPPTEGSTMHSSRVVADLAVQLRYGVPHALRAAYPPAGQSRSITDGGAAAHVAHYQKDEAALPVLSWAPAPLRDTLQVDSRRLQDATIHVAQALGSPAMPSDVVRRIDSKASMEDAENALHTLSDNIRRGAIDPDWLAQLRRQELGLRHPLLARVKPLANVVIGAQARSHFKGFAAQYGKAVVDEALQSPRSVQAYRQELGKCMLERLIDDLENVYF